MEVSGLLGFCKFAASNTSYRFLHQNHYETLNLKRNCSAKEVKDAFIKLSKRYHPDKNTNSNSHAEYVKIVEAYSVLSKSESRRTYDSSLGSQFNNNNYSSTRPRTPYRYHNPSEFYSSYTDHVRRENWRPRPGRTRADFYYDNRNYYSPRVKTRFSNNAIATFCVLFAFFGLGFQVLAIKHSIRQNRQNFMNQSHQHERILQQIAERVAREGYQMQIERFEKELEKDETRK